MKGCVLMVFMAVVAHLTWAQSFSQQGYIDASGFAYPQQAPNDTTQFVGELRFQYQASYTLAPGLHLAGGVDARVDTHGEDERNFHFSLLDRERQRPAFELQSLNLTYSRGKLLFEAGKQVIRWGRTDFVTPTDRFAPQDYLNVINPELLAVTAARLTYGTQANSMDLVYSPRFTPSRIPLLNERWAVLPTTLLIHEREPNIPNGPQFGARFSHVGSSAEYAVSFYQGYDYFPHFHVQPQTSQPAVDVQRFYPPLRMYGGDFVIPLKQLTIKGESAYFTSTSLQSDEYILFVLQLERQFGGWFFLAGYVGQTVTQHRADVSFSVQRGYAKSLVAHAGYTIGVNRSFSVDAAVHQNGQGFWLKPAYTQAIGQHWRATFTFGWIYGAESDFIGQFHRNSFGNVRIRYSF